MTTAANGNGRQPDDPGADAGKNGKGRRLWIEPKISIGNILTVLTLIVLGAIGYAELKGDVKSAHNRITAINANQTRQGRLETAKVLAAIAALAKDVAVLQAIVGEVRRDIPTTGKQ